MRVVIRIPKYFQLSWNRLSDKLQGSRDEYVVLRQNQEFGSASDTTYTDSSIKLDSTYQYQVLARGQDDLHYASNIAVTIPPAPSLRNVPASLTEEQLKLMLKSKKFFDSEWNNDGQGYANQFEQKVINRDTVVIDHTSGLMWQQGGSENSMNFEDAKQWIDALNQKGYAGFKN